jgi:hypothetical protein
MFMTMYTCYDIQVSSSSSTSTDAIDDDVKSAIITKWVVVYRRYWIYTTFDNIDRHAMSVDTTAPCNQSLKLRPTEQKGKMRYLNNEVVSTKGGRHLEKKKEESEEMKKTYINLKPLKQYRFHWCRWVRNYISFSYAPYELIPITICKIFE